MTRIRKINVSQVEGGSADNADFNEIRPFGETAFYLDDNDKLTLMMFDGVRTHHRSKVLKPGVLFGSNADSGDGYGLDTIKLVPDSDLFNNGSHQYLIVDPTAPNHIHLRAGGDIDSSFADLYLGGEQTHVRISDGYDHVAIKTSVDNFGNISSFDWTFDNYGNLTLPNNVLIGQSIDVEVTNAESNYNNQVAVWANWMASGEFTTEPNPGWTFTTWQVNGTNVDQYLAELTAAWQIQIMPSSPPMPLVFEPGISAALYTQLRAVLILIKDSYEIWQSLLSSVDIKSNNAKISVLDNGKLVTPEIIQTTPDEDLTIRTRYTLASSPPGSTPSYQNRDFKFGTNGGLTFPNGTTQYGAAIDLAYLKSIVADSVDFNDFKSKIAAL